MHTVQACGLSIIGVAVFHPIHLHTNTVDNDDLVVNLYALQCAHGSTGPGALPEKPRCHLCG